MNKMLENIKKLLSPSFRLPLLLILLGVLVRFVLMPTSGQLDLFLASRREYLWVFKHIFVMNDIIETSLGMYMWTVKPFLQHLPEIFDIVNAQGTLNLPEFEKIAVFPRIMRYVFILKIPYLVLDVLSLYFIWKLTADRTKRVVMLAFWAFNPAYLFAGYIIGRYEAIPILLITIALYFTKYKKPFWAMLFLGLTIATRMPFVLLVPLFIIYFSDNWKQGIKNTLISLLPLALITKIIAWIWGQNLFADTFQGNFVELMITRSSLGDSIGSISPIILAYPLVVYLFLTKKTKMNFDKLVHFSIIVFLVFYMFGYLGPQYFAWFTPFMMIALAKNRKLLLPFLALLISFFVLQDVFSNTIVTTIGFYISNYNFFQSWSGLRNQELFYSYHYGTLVVALHSVFLLMASWLGLALYKDRNEN